MLRSESWLHGVSLNSSVLSPIESSPSHNSPTAAHPALETADRAEVLEALVRHPPPIGRNVVEIKNRRQRDLGPFRAVPPLSGRHNSHSPQPFLNQISGGAEGVTAFVGSLGNEARRSPAVRSIPSGRRFCPIRRCRKAPNQIGYYRAIAGFAEASGKNFDAASEAMPVGARKELRDPAFRQQIAIPRASFESGLRKRAAKILAARRLA